MATYGTKTFEEQSIRCFIKGRHCKASASDCAISLHPSKIPGTAADKYCADCQSYYEWRHDEMKESMKQCWERNVLRAIRDSCRLGACNTSGVYDCNVCAGRKNNLAKTKKEYFEAEREACHAFLKRVYGVPRDDVGYDHEDFHRSGSFVGSAYKAANKGAFYANWRPFVNSDNKFDCNYPAIILRMLDEDAPELDLIVLPYTVKPKTETSKLNRLSSFMSGKSSGDVYSDQGSHRSSSRASSPLSHFSEKSLEFLRQGGERVKSFTQGSSTAAATDDKKHGIEKLEELFKDKYAHLKRKL